MNTQDPSATVKAWEDIDTSWYPQTTLAELRENADKKEKWPTYEELEESTREAFEVYKQSILDTPHNPNKTNLLVIGTWGTFQSKKNKEWKYEPEGTLLESFRALNLPKDKDVVHHLFDQMNLDSAGLGVEQWRFLADRLVELLSDPEISKRFDGIIITHGTDTMAEGACYLSYMLQWLKKPIIFTGSQKPARAKKTDAKRNMERCFEAMKLAKEEEIAEVMVLCGKTLCRWTWVEKVGDETTDAFRSFPEKGQNVNWEQMMADGEYWRHLPALLDFSLDIPEDKLHFRAHARKIDYASPFSPFTRVMRPANINPIKLTDFETSHVEQAIERSRVTVVQYLGSGTSLPTLARFLADAAKQACKAIVLQAPFADSTVAIWDYAAGSPLGEAWLPILNTSATSLIAKINFFMHFLGIRPVYHEGCGYIIHPDDRARLYRELSRDCCGELLN